MYRLGKSQCNFCAFSMAGPMLYAHHCRSTMTSQGGPITNRPTVSWRTGSGPIFCLLLRVSSDYAQPITGQVKEVTCPVIGQAQPELILSKRQKRPQVNTEDNVKIIRYWPFVRLHRWITIISADHAQPITGQITKVTCPVIGQARPEPTPSKRRKTGPG